jgi:Mg-chelatase subunit ChlD
MPTFSNAAWLLLLVPLALPLSLRPLPGRALNLLRAATLLLLVLALANPSSTRERRNGTVVVVADRSASMPADALARQAEAIGLVHQGIRPGDKLAVVSFGRAAAVEQSPAESAFPAFTVLHDADQSNLADALDTALSLVPEDGGGRILVLSDGLYSGVAPFEAGTRAAVRGVAIDARHQGRDGAGDVAVLDVEAPQRVRPGEGLMVTAWVQAPEAMSAQCRFRQGARVLAAGQRALTRGTNRLVFRDIAGAPGTREYVVEVDGPEHDPRPENNRARLLVQVDGAKPLRIVSPTTSSGYAALLRRSGLDVESRTPETARWTLEELSGCAAVVLENVPTAAIGKSGMELLAAWVEHAGGGLMVTGGKRSFGVGGYFQSPLDPLLPVSMELRKEHRKGSMAMAAGGGKTKMDLANLGVVQVLDMLSDMDELGVLAVDTESHVVVPLTSVTAARSEKGRILGIASQGGGIFVGEGLKSAAAMLARAKAGTRHLILFADAADSEEPGDYRTLLARCKAAGMTCSVVGLGTPADVDAELLRDVAKHGGGEIYFTDDATQIPQLFAQDTMAVSRSTFVEEITPLELVPGFALLGASVPAGPAPFLGGYNLCYLREGATAGALSGDEFRAPLIAFWQAGAGRTAVYTGEADGAFSGLIAQWPHVGRLHGTLARWVAGQEAAADGMLLLSRRTPDGLRIELHLDAARAVSPLPSMPVVALLRGKVGGAPTHERHAMRWVAADLMALDVALAGAETALATVQIPGHALPLHLPPVCLPYSVEHRPRDRAEGLDTLAQLGALTGGGPRADLGGIWRDLPVRRREVPLRPLLTLLAMLVFLLEVAERRIGIFRRRRPVPVTPTTRETMPKEARGVGRLKAREPRGSAVPLPPKAQPSAPQAEGASDTLDALRLARRRADDRLGSGRKPER